jgi:hypothetical protein
MRLLNDRLLKIIAVHVFNKLVHGIYPELTIFVLQIFVTTARRQV